MNRSRAFTATNIAQNMYYVEKEAVICIHRSAAVAGLAIPQNFPRCISLQ